MFTINVPVLVHTKSDVFENVKLLVQLCNCSLSGNFLRYFQFCRK